MSVDPKPKVIDEYLNWALNNLGVDFRSKDCEDEYITNNTNVWAATMLNLDSHLIKTLLDSEDDYHTTRKSELFMSPFHVNRKIEWDRKKYSSVLDKSFRYNIVWNPQYPKEPSYNWLTPENWFSRLNDTVRTMFVCKYIDGPKYLAERLVTMATSLALKHECSSRQKDDGYYAYHFYVTIPTRIYYGTNAIKTDVDIEIQLTTQLQEALNQVTHRYYEKNRIASPTDPTAWKWEIETNRFRIGYLSHTLHLLEAIILETRNTSALSPGK